MFDDDYDGLKLCPVCRDRETTGDKCSACSEQEWYDHNEQTDDDDDDVYGEGDGQAQPEEPGEGEVYCPVCGGYGGESYGSDSGTCPECGGSGVVDENWGEDDEEGDEEE